LAFLAPSLREYASTAPISSKPSLLASLFLTLVNITRQMLSKSVIYIRYLFPILLVGIIRNYYFYVAYKEARLEEGVCDHSID
jgi:hypothetical protein